MSEFEDGSIEALAASIAEREQAGHDPKAGLQEALDSPTEIKPQAAAEESASVEEPIAETAEAASNETVDTPDPAEAPKPLLVTPEKVTQKQEPEPEATPEANTVTNQTLERANAILQQIEAATNTKFADLKTEADVFALMQTDPARYNEFVIAQTQFQRARQAQQFAQGEAQKSYLAGEQKRLIKAIPDLADPEKGEALKAELRAYAKSQGIPDNRQARSADEVIRLHREMGLAKEVAKFQALQAAQAKALAAASEKASVAPAVQKPGVARTNNGNNKLQELEDRFAKTGKPEDLALVFAARGG